MSTLTTNLGLHQAVDGDNAKAYLEVSLAADLAVLDNAMMGNAVGTSVTATKKWDVAQDFKQIATPSAPAAGYNRVYFKNDDFLYRETSAGVEAVIGNGISNGGSVASAATLPIPAVPAGTPQLYLTVTGVSAITDVSGVPALGTEVFIIFGGILTFTHGNHIKMNGGRNFQTAGNAWLHMVSDGTNLWEIAHASPTSPVLGNGTVATNQSITSTASPGTDITGLTTTFTPDGVRDVKITVFLPDVTVVTGAALTVLIQKDGAIVTGSKQNWVSTGSLVGPVYLSYRDPAPTNASHTYKASAFVDSNSVSTAGGHVTPVQNYILAEYVSP